MPELPEVEAARSLVERHCKGKSIRKANAQDDQKVIEGLTFKELEAHLKGRRIAAAGRKAKHLWLELGDDGSPALLLHFGMTGSIIVRSSKGQLEAAKYERVDADVSGAWPPKFTKLDLELEDGTCLAFTDPRRFGKVRWLTVPPLTSEPVSKLAADALNELPTLEQFTAAIQGMSRKKALKIKALLLDQEGLVSGVGNWIADEVLYQAKVHPEQAVISLSLDQIQSVHSSLKAVIEHAVSVDADSARFPRSWLFHYRWTGKKASVDANGQDIDFVTVGSRTSAYVPAIQKLPEAEAAAIAAAIAAKAAQAPRGKSGAKSKGKGGNSASGEAGSGSDGEDASSSSDSAAEEAAPRVTRGRGRGRGAGRGSTRGGARGGRWQKAEDTAGGEDSVGEGQDNGSGGGEGGETVPTTAVKKRGRKAASKEEDQVAAGDGVSGDAAGAKGKGKGRARVTKKGAEGGQEGGEGREPEASGAPPAKKVALGKRAAAVAGSEGVVAGGAQAVPTATRSRGRKKAE